MPRKMTGIRLALVILVIIGISLILAGGWSFKAFWDENTYPKGSQVAGQTYIVEGNVNPAFSDIPNKHHNSTNNITFLSISYGEGWEKFYNLSGDQRDRFHGGDLVILKTTWNDSLDERSQLWSAERYYPPHIQYALLSFMVLLGISIIIISIFIRAEVNPRTAAAMLTAFLLPTPFYVPSYFLDVKYFVAIFWGLFVILLFCALYLGMLVFRNPIKHKKERLPLSIALAVSISSFLVIISGIAVRALCTAHYVNTFL